MVETQPMRAIYLESTQNKKQERLRDVVSQWLNCPTNLWQDLFFMP